MVGKGAHDDTSEMKQDNEMRQGSWWNPVLGITKGKDACFYPVNFDLKCNYRSQNKEQKWGERDENQIVRQLESKTSKKKSFFNENDHFTYS